MSWLAPLTCPGHREPTGVSGDASQNVSTSLSTLLKDFSGISPYLNKPAKIGKNTTQVFTGRRIMGFETSREETRGSKEHEWRSER
jgi:hypothetical protein